MKKATVAVKVLDRKYVKWSLLHNPYILQGRGLLEE